MSSLTRTQWSVQQVGKALLATTEKGHTLQDVQLATLGGSKPHPELQRVKHVLTENISQNLVKHFATKFQMSNLTGILRLLFVVPRATLVLRSTARMALTFQAVLSVLQGLINQLMVLWDASRAAIRVTRAVLV
jgi:hypothetical protein